MKKMIFLLLAVFMFFGCASQKTEGETENIEVSLLEPEVISEENLLTEEVEENEESEKSEVLKTEILENEILNKKEDFLLLQENHPDEKEQNIVLEENNQPKGENEDKSQIEPLEENLSLVITPENFDSPDYVEFLPIITPKNESDIENFLEIPNDTALDFSEEEVSETSILDLLDDSENEELLSDTQKTDLENSEIIDEKNTENQIDNNFVEDSTDLIDTTEVFENTENQDEEKIAENLDDTDIIENTEIIDEKLLAEEESFLPETEDIPLEEIFTPDENFVPLEPEETFEIKENRSMVMNNNQKLLVSFPGTGWIYLGDEYNSDIFIFDKRDIFEDSTDFTLKSNNSGTALLHFFKQDLLTNEPINDYLLVTVNPKKGKLETIEAPDFSYNDVEEDNLEEIIEEDYYDYGIIEDEPEVMFFADDSFGFVEESADTKEILDLAQAFIDDKMVVEALDQLDYYFAVIGDTTDNYTDYALFMKAKLLEENPEVKNIKESVACYKQLVAEFPDSKYWNQAKQRITYLERFYFSVR